MPLPLPAQPCEWYTGSWAFDRRSGQGECTYKNGDVYKGNWARGMCNGLGERTYKSAGKVLCVCVFV